MNFTITASIISILIIALYASSHNRLYSIEYTPFSKLEALDYIVVVNALASGKVDPTLSKGFVVVGLKVKYTIKEKTLRKDVKRLALTIDHGYVKIDVSAFLSLKVIKDESGLTPSGIKHIYLVEVLADRPVWLKGLDIVSVNGSNYVGWTSGRVCDNRGICVEVP